MEGIYWVLDGVVQRMVQPMRNHLNASAQVVAW